MKLIFSRKGFDSATGGKPSPIFPDGTMVSPNLEDMYPFLDPAEVEANLLTPQEA